jgi:PadR family transcriptional regulator, regulatory protein PadR
MGAQPAKRMSRRAYRFLEPCLLIQLSRGRSHGYELLAGSQECGFEGGATDSSVLYRLLRDMDENGLVSSTWDTDGPGRPRRVYDITEDGRARLTALMEELLETDRILHVLSEAYSGLQAASPDIVGGRGARAGNAGGGLGS